MSIYVTVKNKRLALFRSKSIVTGPKVKREITPLKKQIQYMGCKSRQANLDGFFGHENHEYLPSLSD